MLLEAQKNVRGFGQIPSKINYFGIKFQNRGRQFEKHWSIHEFI